MLALWTRLDVLREFGHVPTGGGGLFRLPTFFRDKEDPLSGQGGERKRRGKGEGRRGKRGSGGAALCKNVCFRRFLSPVGPSKCHFWTQRVEVYLLAESQRGVPVVSPWRGVQRSPAVVALWRHFQPPGWHISRYRFLVDTSYASFDRPQNSVRFCGISSKSVDKNIFFHNNS